MKILDILSWNRHQNGSLFGNASTSFYSQHFLIIYLFFNAGNDPKRKKKWREKEEKFIRKFSWQQERKRKITKKQNKKKQKVNVTFFVARFVVVVVILCWIFCIATWISWIFRCFLRQYTITVFLWSLNFSFCLPNRLCGLYHCYGFSYGFGFNFNIRCNMRFKFFAMIWDWWGQTWTQQVIILVDVAEIKYYSSTICLN